MIYEGNDLYSQYRCFNIIDDATEDTYKVLVVTSSRTSGMKLLKLALGDPSKEGYTLSKASASKLGVTIQVMSTLDLRKEHLISSGSRFDEIHLHTTIERGEREALQAMLK